MSGFAVRLGFRWLLFHLTLIGWLAIGYVDLVSVARGASTDELDLRLHVAWGGGDARTWRGRLLLTAGSWSHVVLLGSDADEPGSMLIQGPQILIGQRHPRDYDGLEVTVRAPRDSELRVELLPDGELTARVVSIPLESLLRDYRSEGLDDRKNRLVVRRAASDRIRVDIDHDSWVFAPGQRVTLKARGSQLGVAPDTPLHGLARLTSSDGRTELWQDEVRERADAQGNLAWPRPIALEMPREEGVYELQFSVAVRRRTAPFAGEKQLAERTIEFVVVADHVDTPRAELNQPERRLLFELDPTQANWWQRFTRLPQWSRLPGLRGDGPLGNMKAERVVRGERAWTRLGPAGWQAYPLPVEEVGLWHELELDLPGDVPQSVGISLLEPNAAGKILPVGVDTAFRLTAHEVQGLAVKPVDVATHRFDFWPRGKTPLLLVSNLSDEQESMHGRIRLYRHEASSVKSSITTTKGGRHAFAVFERPLFPESFGAREALDEETGRSLESWTTFLEGAQRMIAYAKRVGYDGLAVACWSEGSTLYPSELLQPTPKHDRGVYFSDGRDAARKDVVELLMRLCDREGLQFVPILEFASPLPELERERLDERRALGIDLVSSSGVRWSERYGRPRGRAAYYNPLDDRVQQAMQRVVREWLDRYSHHPSFAGLAVQLHSEGYSQLPDLEWGCDAKTWERFQSDRDLPDARVDRPWDDRVVQAWLDWRCEQLHFLYEQIGQQVVTRRPEAQLYLFGARLLDSRPLQRAMRPALPRQLDLNLAWKQLGLDVQRLQTLPHTNLLRPQLLGVAEQATEAAAIQEFNAAEEVQAFFARHETNGSLFLHDPTLRRIPGFDEVSPYGKSNTVVSLVTPLTPGGVFNRRRFAQAIAQHDSQILFEGGWVLARGQDTAVRDFLTAFRQLPTDHFTTVTTDRRRSQPLVVRTLTTPDHAYLYVVNDSPWVVGASLTLRADSQASLQWLDQRAERPPQADRRQFPWNITLAPFELVGLVCDRPKLEVVDVEVTLPPDVKPSLENEIEKLVRRAARLRYPTPYVALTNGDFERWEDSTNAFADWIVRGGADQVQRETTDVFAGKQALRLAADSSEVSLRSAPIPKPASNRLSVSLRAKVPADAEQPLVRLVLEVDGQTYYPWSAIGVETTEHTLTPAWKEFVFRVNHLPIVQDSLRIGFEVSGTGTVFIDDVRVFDMLILDDDEQKALAHLVTVVDQQQRNGWVADCLQSLSSYWPRYLLDAVVDESPEMAQRKEVPVDRPAAKEAAWPRWRPLRNRK